MTHETNRIEMGSGGKKGGAKHFRCTGPLRIGATNTNSEISNAGPALLLVVNIFSLVSNRCNRTSIPPKHPIY